MARLKGGEIFIGPTDEELEVEGRQNRASEIERRLREIDAKSDRPARQIAMDLVILMRTYRTGGYGSLGKQEAGARRPSPDTDGRRTRNLPACGRKSRRRGRRMKSQKKRRSSSQRRDPGDGVPVHEGTAERIHHSGEGREFSGSVAAPIRSERRRECPGCGREGMRNRWV
jgi:hypothetical protein